jgi:hypothetical protein
MQSTLLMKYQKATRGELRELLEMIQKFEEQSL